MRQVSEEEDHDHSFHAEQNSHILRFENLATPKRSSLRLSAAPPALKQMWRVWKDAVMPSRETAVAHHPERFDLKDTERTALDAARAHAKAQEAKWYALIRGIDARIEEIETAEVRAENNICPECKGKNGHSTPFCSLLKFDKEMSDE